MQTPTVAVTLALLIASAASASVGNSQQVGGQPISQSQSLTEETSLDVPSELTRLKKSAYGGASVPSVPCPKSYLFSCQPNLAPVPCASGGPAGAYSSPIPTYALPWTKPAAPVGNWHHYYY